MEAGNQEVLGAGWGVGGGGGGGRWAGDVSRGVGKTELLAVPSDRPSVTLEPISMPRVCYGITSAVLSGSRGLLCL